MAYIDKSNGDRGLRGVNPEAKRRKARKIDILHLGGKRSEVNYGFIILPIGTFYNADIARARRGDVVRYVDGTENTIYDMCIVRIGSSVFRNLCRLRYGCEASRVLNQWRRTAIGMGYAPDAIDGERAAVVFFKYDDDKGL